MTTTQKARKRLKLKDDQASETEIQAVEATQTALVTAENQSGRRLAKLNAVKHGLDAKEIILSHLGETEEDWNEHLSGIIEHWMPRDTYEAELTNELASATWLLRRVRAYRRETTAMFFEDAEDYAKRQARQVAQKDSDVDFEIPLERFQRQASLPTQKALEKADLHLGRLMRQIREISAELRAAKADSVPQVRAVLHVNLSAATGDLKNEMKTKVVDAQVKMLPNETDKRR